MPNLYSAVKRMRVAEKARGRNRSAKSEISSRRRRFFEISAAQNIEKSRGAFSAYCSALDKAAIKGIIPKNTAIRRKRRAAARLSTLKPAAKQG
ncbi:MAG: 30S ribosomal protein S20 [Lentisphaerae bacterium]|nr:30S ribosomal protein S20 [Lentisphaerota bacterium]